MSRPKVKTRPDPPFTACLGAGGCDEDPDEDADATLAVDEGPASTVKSRLFRGRPTGFFGSVDVGLEEVPTFEDGPATGLSVEESDATLVLGGGPTSSVAGRLLRGRPTGRLGTSRFGRLFRGRPRGLLGCSVEERLFGGRPRGRLGKTSIPSGLSVLQFDGISNGQRSARLQGPDLRCVAVSLAALLKCSPQSNGQGKLDFSLGM